MFAFQTPVTRTGNAPNSLPTAPVTVSFEPSPCVISPAAQGLFHRSSSTTDVLSESLPSSCSTLSAALQDRFVHPLKFLLAKSSVGPPGPLPSARGAISFLREGLARHEEVFVALDERYLAHEERVESLKFKDQSLLQQN